VNQFKEDVNAGYDQNPQFSPDGKYIAWSSMERDGYESDRTRLCIYEFATGKKSYVTESFESGVNEFAWASDNSTLYFSGVWHGKTNLYSTNLSGEVKQITDEVADFVLLGVHPLPAPGESSIYLLALMLQSYPNSLGQVNKDHIVSGKFSPNNLN
jgi:hypothetical protein